MWLQDKVQTIKIWQGTQICWSSAQCQFYTRRRQLQNLYIFNSCLRAIRKVLCTKKIEIKSTLKLYLIPVRMDALNNQSRVNTANKLHSFIVTVSVIVSRFLFGSHWWWSITSKVKQTLPYPRYNWSQCLSQQHQKSTKL